MYNIRDTGEKRQQCMQQQQQQQQNGRERVWLLQMYIIISLLGNVVQL